MKPYIFSKSVWTQIILLAGFFFGNSTPLLAAKYSLEQVLQTFKNNKNNTSLSIIEQAYQADDALIMIGKSSAFPNVELSLRGTRFLGNDRAKARGPRGEPLGAAYGLNATITQPLITFGRLGSVWTIANLTGEKNELVKELSINSALFKVLQYYGDAVIKEEKSLAQKKSASILKSLWTFTQVEYNGGARNRIDFLRSKSAYEVAKASTQFFEVEARSSVRKLQNLLSIPLNKPFKLASVRNIDSNRFFKINSKNQDRSLELKLKTLETKLLKEQITYQRSNYFPTLSAFGNAGTSSQTKLSEVATEENFTYSYGLQLTWNLFSGFKTTAEYRQSKANARKAELELGELEREVQISKEESYKKIEFSKQIYLASKASKEAAKLAFEKGDLDYRAGTITLTELLNLEKTLLEAEQSLAEAYVNHLLIVGRYKLLSGQDLY